MQDSKRDTDVKNSLLDSVGEGEGGMIWEGSAETCILSYVKQIASPGLMHETGCSGLVHWDDPEGWDGEGGGRGVQDGGHMYIHGWFMSMHGKKPLQYCKVISLQLKKKKKLCIWAPEFTHTHTYVFTEVLLSSQRWLSTHMSSKRTDSGVIT